LCNSGRRNAASTFGSVRPWEAPATTAINFSNTLSAASTLPVFLVLGIEFYQEVNGEEYPLKNGSFNALSIVKASGV